MKRKLNTLTYALSPVVSLHHWRKSLKMMKIIISFGINKRFTFFRVSFDDYITCDDEVATAGALTKQEIIDAVINTDDVEDEENGNFLNNVTPDPPISIGSAKKAINDLRAFIEGCEDINDEIFSSLHNIERIIDVEN
ncbi:hypothetical protein KQX54_005411 [Cotesia glomerata]|uniref:Uncharacterized protein n=1 Tax=Cotesia glomerata TaxID=32391 RepID=A0AAV7HSD6_COTGL|nr:hypothetical protein KQX54_005411 [Cotesia glomerata]